MTTKSLIVIGDTHFNGTPNDKNWIEYKKICLRAQSVHTLSGYKHKQMTLSVGDNGFLDSYKQMESSELLPENHKWLQGNHDYYEGTIPHVIGDYGLYVDNEYPDMQFFYVRGADSIDKSSRIQGYTWFPNEELSYDEFNTCSYLYEAVKPNIMITHDCPQSIREKLFGIKESSITSQWLDAYLSIHKPKLWVFGHHHQSVNYYYNNTLFVCLKELQTMEINF